MPYIDAEYYNNEFQGEPASSTEELDRLIDRASDLVDQATSYKLHNVDFSKLPLFIQDQVKKATAYQVEYYIVNGGASEVDAGTDGSMTSVTVGAFSYSGGGSEPLNGSARNISRLSPSALGCLSSTGLLNQAIEMFRGWC